jgi:hypothetical protein
MSQYGDGRNQTVIGTINVSDTKRFDPSIKPSDISFTNNNPTVGETITIYAKIYNFGNVNGVTTVEFYNGNPSSSQSQARLIHTKSISLSAGGNKLISAQWNIFEEGSHDIYVSISKSNPSDESLDNNIAFSTITVGPGGEPVLVIAIENTGISKFEPGTLRTLTASVYCYNSNVENVELVIIDNDNVPIKVITPPGDISSEGRRDYLINIEVPELEWNMTYMSKTLVIQAISKDGITSNAEPIEIIISDTNTLDSPGFTSIALFAATGLGSMIAYFRKRQ